LFGLSPSPASRLGGLLGRLLTLSGLLRGLLALGGFSPLLALGGLLAGLLSPPDDGVELEEEDESEAPAEPDGASVDFESGAFSTALAVSMGFCSIVTPPPVGSMSPVT